ncbi:threonine ammonia-lyase, biosynthetic [Hyphomicrobium sulfonivorans]|uniref:threonine ammonia-lyase, biosynthetic n=1 Tax=Hyphomicrobium sulfonivorans TaxID=121290 RepID=UPI00156E4610|nr:threonine ammonia-lyase, biosynthetic [Hyphomicrobium sulfonivorans]NSL71536.1 threonine ammonia-lyase, biosynthetic [Hyphomicrobium sulfonivorans]
MQDYVRKVLGARVYDVAIDSPLDDMPRLSKRLHNRVLLKREDLQPVFSFKLRGAYNKMAGLSPEALERGVICASAGNHAQGVALSARMLGTKATIVMPCATPGIKVQAVRSRGGNVVLHGENFDEAAAHARKLEAEQGLVFIHPYDDPDVIAGQGTIGMEILRHHPDPIEAIFVPIGGGGLAAGIAIYTKFLRPEIKIIGVEPDDAACMQAAVRAGERVLLNHVGFFADGAAVRLAGEETFRICREYLDDIITVTTDEVCSAIKDIFEDTRAVPEPAGALSLAGLKQYAEAHDVSDRTLVAINSGANMDFDRLRHISERAEIGEHREALLSVTIPETPGSYRRFIQLLGRRAITEFNYRFADPKSAHIFVGVRLSNGETEKQQIIATLADNGYGVVDMSNNEMAKLHVRYMVGGRVEGLDNEMVFRFQFPERPGALLQFLDSLSDRWNITLFHYRNHGADYGRVLAGIDVPPHERADLKRSLDELSYPYWDESDNPAYASFLSDRNGNGRLPKTQSA